jgi:periplasmic divalent cation tolerance protein
MTDPADVWVALITAPPTDAPALARALVTERLAACVNLLPGMTSVYRWRGEVHEDGETLLVVKTTRDRFPVLRQRVRELHPYDLPECIAVPVTSGIPEYLEWVTTECEADG